MRKYTERFSKRERLNIDEPHNNETIVNWHEFFVRNSFSIFIDRTSHLLHFLTSFENSSKTSPSFYLFCYDSLQ